MKDRSHKIPNNLANNDFLKQTFNLYYTLNEVLRGLIEQE